MPKDIPTAIREVCLSLPEAIERSAHGMADFRARDKTFATFALNHHGDGRTALWIPAPPGTQALWVDLEPSHYFVPPYVGSRGWLGVHLDRGLGWDAIADRVVEAYRHTAPPALHKMMDVPIRIDPPDLTVDPIEFDPMNAPRAQAVLAAVRAMVESWPEVSEGDRFGRPAWRAGKKAFATLERAADKTRVLFWVGGEAQAMLTADPRYEVPRFSGPNGWISLDVESHLDDDEVHARLIDSYRHFALKRMLKQLS